MFASGVALFNSVAGVRIYYEEKIKKHICRRVVQNVIRYNTVFSAQELIHYIIRTL